MSLKAFNLCSEKNLCIQKKSRIKKPNQLLDKRLTFFLHYVCMGAMLTLIMFNRTSLKEQFDNLGDAKCFHSSDFWLSELSGDNKTPGSHCSRPET